MSHYTGLFDTLFQICYDLALFATGTTLNSLCMSLHGWINTGDLPDVFSVLYRTWKEIYAQAPLIGVLILGFSITLCYYIGQFLAGSL